MKNIFIIGSRGYNASYGGWETFVTNLANHYNDKNTTFYITSYTDNKEEQTKKITNNIISFPIYIKQKGSTAMFLNTIKSLKYCIKYIEENNIKNSYIYILGLKLFNYLSLYEKKLKKLNIKTLVNPDGLEHERSKWSYPIKKFFLLSEKLMLNHTNMIICDAKGIEEYIHKKYPHLKNKTTYIAYGSEIYNFNNINEEKILKEYNLKKDLVIITNLKNSKYYEELIAKTNCLKDKRIHFINGVYNKEKLATIRKNAYLYIHGHSVGGTNPSLIEALSLTDLNILYDVCFNKDIGGESCLYFKEKGSLTKILNNQKELESKKDKLGILAKKIIKENYTWEIIVKQYKEIFK